MKDILVKPNQLRDTATVLQSSSKTIKQALSRTDELLISLGVGIFEGFRASDIQRIYRTVSGRISIAPDKITVFARMLEAAAQRFENADRAISTMVTVGLIDPALVRAEYRRVLEEKWQKMNVEERTKFLRDMLKKFAKGFGLPDIPVFVKDEEDSGGDAMGYYDPGLQNPFLRFILGVDANPRIVIDLTNIDGTDSHSSPLELMDTIAHEGRHALQHYFVEHPDKRPSNISHEQIETWKKNFDHYKKPEDDFQKYRNQPVETDARDFAGSYIVDYTSNPDNLADFK